MGIFFIKLPEHYVFDYKPMYYDPQKEEREKRFKQIDKELGLNKDKEGSEENYRPEIKFRRHFSYHKRHRTNRLISLAITLVIIFLLFYLFLATPFLEKFFQLLEH